MTKVLLNGYFLEYQRDMAEIAGKIVRGRHIDGVKTVDRKGPPLAQADMLLPPMIERLDLFFYRGEVDNLIWLQTSQDFGIENLYLTFKDEHGKLIESGNASQWPDEPDRWEYWTKASVPIGTSVIVYAAAIDGFGAMGALSQTVTIRA
jgi:hypothetical protein